MAYDIFISYRRKGAGAGVAGELQAKLENLGYKVFLDVDEIGSGQFPTQIKKAIEECKDFVLVLSPGTLDRCVEEEDWVRREIIMAQDLDKNIVGVGLPGFVMPDAESLPQPLQPLATRQVFLWTHEYRTASFEKIEENLVSTQLRKKRNRQKIFVLVPAALVLLSAVLLLTLKPGNKTNEPVETNQELVDARYESQSFDYHYNRASNLTKGLPDAVDFKNNIVQMVSDKEPFVKLMEGIAECDSALMLKNQYGDLIADTYDVDDKYNTLLDLRQSYYNAIISDITVLLDEGGEMFASQDMEIAGVLALPEEQKKLDSLNAIIQSRLNK